MPKRLLNKVVGWCDGSTHKTTGVSAVLVITEDTHLFSQDTPLFDITDSTRTELYGVKVILERLTTEFPEVKEVDIMIDSESIVVAYNKLRRGMDIFETGPYADLWQSIMQCTTKLKVRLEHYRGHAYELNPQKVCDISGRVIRQCGMDML